MPPHLVEDVKNIRYYLASKLYYFAAKLDDGAEIADVCKSWNVICDAYLLACHLYYKKDDPLMSDASFDRLVKYIQKHEQEVRNNAVYGEALLKPFGPSSSHAIIIPRSIIALAGVFND